MTSHSRGSATEEGDDRSSEANDFQALQTIIQALASLTLDRRRRVLESAGLFLGISFGGGGAGHGVVPATSPPTHTRPPFSEDLTMSPKEFLFDKRPKSDVERVACLAFYLTHFRDQPDFKTLDISKLNTEAAQLKLSNPAAAVSNAVRTGFIVPSTKGMRQLSAIGEKFVLALPDRDAAREALASARPRRKSTAKRPGSQAQRRAPSKTA